MNPMETNIILGAALALSEALSLIPAIKANGLLQLVFRLLARLVGK